MFCKFLHPCSFAYWRIPNNICKSANLPRDALLKIYKSFIRPHLDYGDITYDKPHNESLENKVENIQDKACIAITGGIQGTSREHFYNELDLEFLGDRRRCRKLNFFIKL